MGKNKRHIEKYFDFTDKVRAVNYYSDVMMNKTVTMFKYNDLPDTIPERDMELIIQQDGRGIVADWNDTLLAFDGNYAPPNNAYYRGGYFIVENPWADVSHTFLLVNQDIMIKNHLEGEHKPAVLIRNDPTETGLLPIVHKYGAMLTEIDLTMYNAFINYRSLFLLSASTNREAESLNNFLNNLIDGKLSSVMEEELSNGIKTQPYSNSSQGYITQLIEGRQYVWGMFLNEIGLNANYNMKRERLSASETDLNEDSLRPLIDAMLEERQKACDEINKQFGTHISVEFNSAWEKYNPDYVEDEEIEDEPVEVRSEDYEDEGDIVEPTETDDIDNDDADDDNVTEDISDEEEQEAEEKEEEKVEVNVEINVEAEEAEVEAEVEEETEEEETEESEEEETEEEEKKEDED